VVKTGIRGIGLINWVDDFHGRSSGMRKVEGRGCARGGRGGRGLRGLRCILRYGCEQMISHMSILARVEERVKQGNIEGLGKPFKPTR
jgi:hypothetical protein